MQMGSWKIPKMYKYIFDINVKLKRNPDFCIINLKAPSSLYTNVAWQLAGRKRLRNPD